MGKKLVIGISGTFASGKGTLADSLARHFNLINVSTSDMLAEEAMREFGNTDRPSKFAVAERLRKTKGGGVLAEMALEKFKQDSAHDGVLVSDLRSLGEANVVKKAGGVIIFVDAPLELRYQRMQSRARDIEANISQADFAEREKREWYAGPSDADFNLRGIKAMADIRLSNDSSVDVMNRDATEAVMSWQSQAQKR